MNLVCVLLIDLGLVAVAVGGLSMIKPLRFLFVATRPAGAILATAGLAMLTVGLLLPASPMRLSAPPMRLDEFVPEYQFGEEHETRVHASAEATFRAIRAVTAGEIRFFSVLTWIRSPHLPGQGRESILNAPANEPVLDVATRSGFFLV